MSSETIVELSDAPLFAIGNKALRHPIIPLLEIDERSGLAAGLGTAFRIDPFGQYLTAQHVLEHRFAGGRGRGSVVGLLNPGFGPKGGTVAEDRLARIEQASTFRTKVEDPQLDKLMGWDSSRNVFDCLKLSFDAFSSGVHDVRSFLPMRLRGWPKVGDKVTAIGFPELKSFVDQKSQDVTLIREQMFGSTGAITALYPTGREHRPWPTLEVDVHWPSGMSGGPVLNGNGEVIGLVSSSDEPESVDAKSYAFWFGPLRDFHRWIPHVDPDNPGWVRGWAVRRSEPWHVAAFLSDRVSAQRIADARGKGYEVKFGSLKAGTDDFMSFEPNEFSAEEQKTH